MSGTERRENIIRILKESNGPVSAGRFAREYHVSRQVIVQDVALLRAAGYKIFSTARGYVIEKENKARRVFKVYHTPDKSAEEMTLIVDCGGKIVDVFVYHRIYGLIRAKLNVDSRLDVQRYQEEITTGKSTELSKITSGYHYHTVEADDEATLDLIQEKLGEAGFLAKLQDYEPVNFWEQEKK